MTTTALIEHQTIGAICENVAQAKTDIAHAFALLQGAKERLGAVLGSGGYKYYDHIFARDISDYNLPDRATESLLQCERNAWRYVIDLCGLQSYMTDARQRELHEQLDKGKFPPLTVENVLSTLHGLTSQVDALLTESAKEVFDWLRPSPHSHAGRLKTNAQWHVGHKVIVGYAVESAWGGGYHIRYGTEPRFRALGNVFSLLDGQGAQKHPETLALQLNEGLKTCSSGDSVTTPYLRCKPYKNGNAHLTFTRPDLVDKLNALASDGTLPGHEPHR